jgi:hypothetical protein
MIARVDDSRGAMRAGPKSSRSPCRRGLSDDAGVRKMLLAHKALHRTPITFFSREIHSSTFDQSANNHFTETGNGVGSVLNGNGK